MVEISQRNYDGKWVVWRLTTNTWFHKNAPRWTQEILKLGYLPPQEWITRGVFSTREQASSYVYKTMGIVL